MYVQIFTYCQEDYIISGSTDKHIVMNHAKTGVVEIDFSLGARVQCMVSQGSLLVAGLSNGFIHLIDLQTKSALGRWLVGDDPVRKDISCLAIHNNRLLTASYDNKISCWDISCYVGGSGGSILARIHQISSFSDMVLCMQVEGDLLYCGSADTTLQIFDTQTWASCGRVKGHNGAISGLCVNGNLLITSCFDRFIRCFDARDKTLLQVYSISDLPFTLYSFRDSVSLVLYTTVTERESLAPSSGLLWLEKREDHFHQD
jgi:WD40 repeat protein